MNIDHVVESVLHTALEPTISTQNAGISKDSDLSSGSNIRTMSRVWLSFGCWHLCIFVRVAQVGHTREVLYIWTVRRNVLASWHLSARSRSGKSPLRTGSRRGIGVLLNSSQFLPCDVRRDIFIVNPVCII